MLEVVGVSTYYGQIQALKGVSLSVNDGEIVTLIGANGAGKTTLLNTICGVLAARRGDVVFDGQHVTKLPAERIVRLGISHVPERRQVFGEMSVKDNLILGAYHRYGKEKRAVIDRDLETIFELFPILKQREKQAAGTLSGGQQQMLAVGRGLMSRPRLLLLDEPSLGLAPMLVREIIRIVGELRDRGTTVLLIEQNARAALRIADRGYLIETGRIVLEGTAAELIANPIVQSAYLGKGYHHVS
ncbi:MAG: ABC transporter ATP-binding protein [Chloroflexi bacterium]|nr:ABC transporter ATP-binding protein [Chloroflexota bacterium]MDA8188631.1 ABC transporter ATP-binding protein [Dehalococcoidales bacterium]